MENSTDNILHITVGASTTGKLDVTHDLRLIKAAMLYADKIKLVSLTSSMLVSILPMISLTEDQTIDFLAQTLPSLKPEQSQELLLNFEKYRQLRRKKIRTSKELVFINNFGGVINNTRRNLQAVVEKQAKEAGIEGLLEAINTGLVEFELLDVSGTKAADKYFENIMSMLLSNKSYPLLDDSTSSLVNAAITLGKLKVLGSTLARSRQAGLAYGLFERLPLFDAASIDEIMDIRKELDKPLIRFRSAIIKFSKEIRPAQWEQDFSFDVDQVFRETVEPAVLEIEEAYRSNNLLVKLIKSFSEKSLLISGTSFIGMLMSQADQLPSIVSGALSAAAGAAVIGLDTVNNWRGKDTEISHNQLYFYYRVNKKLE